MNSKKNPSGPKASQRMTSRQLQALQTKDRIYQSALHVMETQGYKDASIEAITTDAGVSTGSFYTYFTSKEQLILYTVMKTEEIYQHAYQAAERLPFPDNLFTFVKLSYFALEQRGKEIMYGVMSNYLSPEFKSNVLNPDRAFYRCMQRLIQSGKEQGQLQEDISDAAYAQKIFTTLTGVEMLWCMLDYRDSLSALAEDAVKDLVKGLAAK